MRGSLYFDKKIKVRYIEVKEMVPVTIEFYLFKSVAVTFNKKLRVEGREVPLEIYLSQIEPYGKWEKIIF